MTEKQHTVTLLMKEFVTRDTQRFITTKPDRYQFTPGQATEVAMNKPEWKEEKRPFTFTNHNHNHVLEFIIKEYPDHAGVTQQLHTLTPGDELLIGDPWGTIHYKGPGTFIAGGAGVTPFIAIFRELAQKNELEGNKLFFANKTQKDIILQPELNHLFGEDITHILSKEQTTKHHYGRIDKTFLEQHIKSFDQPIYLCGPPAMVNDLKQALEELGASTEEIVFEE